MIKRSFIMASRRGRGGCRGCGGQAQGVGRGFYDREDGDHVHGRGRGRFAGRYRGNGGAWHDEYNEGDMEKPDDMYHTNVDKNNLMQIVDLDVNASLLGKEKLLIWLRSQVNL